MLANHSTEIRFPARYPLATALLMLGAVVGSVNAETPLGYPAAVRDAQVDVYHGIKVADPYRWLEDIDSSDTRAWVSAEDRLSRGFLDSLAGPAQLGALLPTE